LLSITLILCFNITVFGQTRGINRDKYRINITRTNIPIIIDGILDDEQWKTAERVGNFHTVTPSDTGFAIAQTEVMLSYDESNLYVGVICMIQLREKDPLNRCAETSVFRRTIISCYFSTHTMI